MSQYDMNLKQNDIIFSSQKYFYVKIAT